MNTIIAISMLACIATASAQSYSGQIFVAGADIAAQVDGDIQDVTGYTRIRTENGNQLFFESALNHAVDITAVHLHLTPQEGVVNGGPLVLALTNTSAAVGKEPLSAPYDGPLVQIGDVGDANLAANPQLAAARAGILALGIYDNALENIGDIDRLFRAGVLYSDVHSVTRVSPNRVGSGLITLLPPDLGRKMI